MNNNHICVNNIYISYQHHLITQYRSYGVCTSIHFTSVSILTLTHYRSYRVPTSTCYTCFRVLIPTQYKTYNVHTSTDYMTFSTLTSTSSCVKVSGSSPIMFARCLFPTLYWSNCSFKNSSKINTIYSIMPSKNTWPIFNNPEPVIWLFITFRLIQLQLFLHILFYSCEYSATCLY